MKNLTILVVFDSLYHLNKIKFKFFILIILYRRLSFIFLNLWIDALYKST
jgi:hypothetical protein